MCTRRPWMIASTPLVLLALLTLACGEEQLGKVLPKIAVSPRAIDLGATPIGVLAKHEVTISNVGAGALLVSSVELVDEEGVPMSPDLSVELPTTFPATLMVNGTLDVEVRHLPKDDLLDSGVLRIRSDDATEKSIDVTISQDALGAPRVAPVPDLGQADAEADLPSGVTSTVSAIALGTVGVGDTGTFDFWVVNAGTGNVPLRVSDVSVQGAVTTGLTVVADPDLDASRVLLPMFGSASRAASLRAVHVTLTWQPTSRGIVLDAVLRISSSDASRRQLDIPITGSSSMPDPPVLRFDPAQGLDLGGIDVGQTITRTFTAYNDGGSNLVIQPLVFGTNPGSAFALVDPPAVVTIPPGGSHAYGVTFTPPARQTYGGTLAITANDPARANPISYALNGTGSAMSCTPQTTDPGEPTNDACATSVDRGSMALPANMAQTTTWSDAMLYGMGDTDWSTVMLTVDAGCFLVGYDITATATLPSGEQAEVCIQTGDCASPSNTQCGTNQAHLLLFPGDDVCNAFGNNLPVRVKVRHSGGDLTCTNYSLRFTAR